MILLLLVNKNDKNFVRHFYIRDHIDTKAGTYMNHLPPGHINPYSKVDGDGMEFLEGEKSRKYNVWDVMDQEVRRDVNGRVVNERNVYVIDETENY